MELLQENKELRSGEMFLTSSTNSNNDIQNIIGDTVSRNSDENINNDNIRFNNPNEEIISNESSYKINGPIFIIKFYPNKFYCILIFILNLIPGGLGTILLGINRSSLKYIFGGIIHFIIIDCSCILGVILLEKEELFKKPYKKSLPIYLLITSGFFYLISIYIGIISNFVFINTKRVSKFHKKEFGIFILLLNLIIPGLGTLMIQTILPNKCIIRAKRSLTGIAQLAMFIILFIFFTGIDKMNENFLLFIFLAIVEYLYTIGTSICFLRNIMISDNIFNEIDV